MEQSALAILVFALSITAPIFAMMFIGMALVRFGWLDDAFIKGANQFIHKLGLPLLLFTACLNADLRLDDKLNLLIAFTLMTLLVFLGSWLTAYLGKQGENTGVIVQGSFRGNQAIIGFAMIANAYGDQGLAMAMLPVAITMVIYNLLAVYILSRNSSWRSTLNNIVMNPLIIAIAAGWLCNLLHIKPPQVFMDTSNYLSQMVLPLALLCIGGSLSLRQLFHIDSALLTATTWKLLLSPLIACALGIALGIRGDLLVVLFLLAASPTAAASYIVAAAMGANGKLAAQIVAQTTFLALPVITLGLVIISYLGAA